jgi:stress response protein YsnF
MSLVFDMNSVPPSDDSNPELIAQSHANSNPEDASRSEQLTEETVMNIELYEELPKLDREIVVRENVQIKKILMQKTADSQR